MRHVGNALLPEYACLPVVFFFPTWLPVLRMPSITGPAPCACLSVYAYCTLRQLAYFPPALPPCWCGNIPVACHLPLPSHASVHTPHSLGIPTPLQCTASRRVQDIPRSFSHTRRPRPVLKTTSGISRTAALHGECSDVQQGVYSTGM